jgi:GT2 family glycosyltransferase
MPDIVLGKHHIPMFVFCYNREEYVIKSLLSLFKSDYLQFNSISPLFVIDDGSDSRKLLEFYDYIFKAKEVDSSRIVVLRNNTHMGLGPGSFERIISTIMNSDVQRFVLADSDALYAKDWFPALLGVYDRALMDGVQVAMATGFDTRDHFHAAYETHKYYSFKPSCGGVNLLVNADFYRRHPFMGKHWDWDASANAAKEGMKIVSSLKSIVQHIGAQGLFSQPGNYDTAKNFIGEDRNALEALAVPIS